MKYFLLTSVLSAAALCAEMPHQNYPERMPPIQKSSGKVIPHEHLPAFGMNGNCLVGLCTYEMGAKEHEVWRSSIAVGSSTPKHCHNAEEVFIFLQGEGRLVIGDEELFFKAPCTVITPANIEHQYFNTGSIPTDAIVIINSHSDIYDAEGEEMTLPWRGERPSKPSMRPLPPERIDNPRSDDRPQPSDRMDYAKPNDRPQPPERMDGAKPKGRPQPRERRRPSPRGRPHYQK